MTDKPDDPFDRVRQNKAAGAGASAGGDGRETGELVAPIPADAPPLPSQWKGLGAPVAAWAYRDATGLVLRWTLRFAKADGEKDIRPATLWRDKTGKLRWRFAGEHGARPLYGLDRLAERPSAPVLMVEGEKTADAAGERFPDYIAMTWPGGSNAVAKADFSALQGRHVVIWGDADTPGRKAAQAAASAALAAGALSAAAVNLPSFLPKGWDLADGWPPAFSAADAAALLAEARAQVQTCSVEWPFGFRMDGDGLWYDQPTQNGGMAANHLSAPFEILGEAREPDGNGWSVVIRFKDRDGREKTIPISRARLVSGGAEVRAELAGAGLIVSPARNRADKFAIALAEVKCTSRLVLVSATGWCGEGRFVLPDEVIGPAGGEPVLFLGDAQALHYRKAGSLDGWRATVAAKAEGNALLTFALSTAFLGPLLRPLEIEGGGVHFRGDSSCGKTTLALAAGSVWGGGGPLGFGQTWRTTANALEMVAYGRNDCLAVLDEIALVAPEEVGGAAYSLASGQAKGRARPDGSLRRRSEWRVAIISTGEIGLADHMAAGKKAERPMAGQELRLLDVAADAGAGMGVWEALHGAPGPAALSDAIKAACGRDYGHAGPAFLRCFVTRRADALAIAKDLLAAFRKTVERPGDSGQAQRAALRFGAIAVAGELAILFGVVPWPPGDASAAAAKLYHRWADAFGRDTPREERQILHKLRDVIQAERSAFGALGDNDMADDASPSRGVRDGEARQLKQIGHYHVADDGPRFLFHDAGWKYVFQGFDLTAAAKAVAKAGFLETDGDKNRFKKSFKVKGQRLRFYCVKASILEADLGDG